jgi:hypothetical protein
VINQFKWDVMFTQGHGHASRARIPAEGIHPKGITPPIGLLVITRSLGRS